MDAMTGLRQALAAYRADPINADDRWQSWEALDVLLAACDAAVETQPELPAGTTPLHLTVPVPYELVPDAESRARLSRAAAEAVLGVLYGVAKMPRYPDDAQQPTPAWVVPDGYQPDGVGACSTCHQHVLWVHTRNAKRMPLDPDGRSHFATCPQADQHRRRSPRQVMSERYSDQLANRPVLVEDDGA